VWTPDRLTDEQLRLFRELALHEGDPPGKNNLWHRIKDVLGA
jgi:hypothetical protein